MYELYWVHLAFFRHTQAIAWLGDSVQAVHHTCHEEGWEEQGSHFHGPERFGYRERVICGCRTSSFSFLYGFYKIWVD